MQYKKQWLVKDYDSEYILINATSYSIGGDGLIFYLNEEKVAHFIKWTSYRLI